MSGTAGLSYPVIIEGQIEKNVLERLNLQVNWLTDQLKAQGIQASDVFFAYINEQKELNLALNNPGGVLTLPPIFH